MVISSLVYRWNWKHGLAQHQKSVVVLNITSTIEEGRTLTRRDCFILAASQMKLRGDEPHGTAFSYCYMPRIMFGMVSFHTSSLDPRSVVRLDFGRSVFSYGLLLRIMSSLLTRVH